MTETELTEQPITDHAATAEVSATEVPAVDRPTTITLEDGRVMSNEQKPKPFEVGQEVFYVDITNGSAGIRVVCATVFDIIGEELDEDFQTGFVMLTGLNQDGEDEKVVIQRDKVFADQREAYTSAYETLQNEYRLLNIGNDRIVDWLLNRQKADSTQEMLAKLQPVGAVYPSEELSVWADPNDRYGGAHSYYLRRYIAFRDGKPTYSENLFGLQFNSKLDDGTPTEGVMSEQLLLILLDRHNKLNNVFPHATHDKFRRGLEMALEACRERVDDRVSRGVMGELKA